MSESTFNTDDFSDLASRISEYLSAGGLFNPESMDHEKVRDLLMEIRALLWRAQSNARLISAATDLLAACEELQRILTSPSRIICDVTQREMLPYLPQVEAAIRKAKGTP